MTAPLPPEASLAFYAQGQTVTAAVTLAVRNAWRQFDPTSIEASFAAILNQLVASIAAGQVAASRAASGYVPRLLDELGLDGGDPQGATRPAAFVGSSSGLSLPETLDSVRLRSLYAASAGGDASASGLTLLEGITQTQIADASRLATSAEIAVRPKITGWVRMIHPGACDRCIVLAGRFYRWSEGFQRHDRCKCKHIPAVEDVAGDLRTDADAYFRSLSEAEQNRAFGRARAQALRDGADMSQVVNSRKGVYTAQVFGRRIRATTSGTTSRGAYGRAQADLAKQSGQRYRRSRTPRLTPESIYKIAADRDDAIRLLKLYRYIN
jgi:hypothetical protein